MKEVTPNALTALTERYFIRDEQGSIIEDVEQLWHRIAYAISDVELTDDNRTVWYYLFRAVLEEQDFLPNTPTIMNAGRENGQLSACFVLPIQDSMAGIFSTLKDAAIIHKTGGGTGFDFSRLRPEGSMVSNKSGVSTGPLAFCQVYDKATDVVKQGATRRGANMMNLRVDHPDILEFIDMKMTPGVMTNFNVSVTITDAFMEALEHDEEYELHHPVTGVTGTLRAKDVFDKIASNAWKSAEPGIIFIDRVNDRSPYHENIEATNPCGEQPLPPYGSCNLGSINLSNFIRYEGTESYGETGRLKPVVDWKRLADVTRTAVRFLDNVIDANSYPIEEIETHTKRYRNIGLGVMGWADALIKLGIPYNSAKAVDLADGVQRYINIEAHNYSYELGVEKGLPDAAPFKSFFAYSDSNRRNATLTTVAPTGSLCIIANCSSGIEPNFAFSYEKHVLGTVLTELHPLYEEAKRKGKVDDSVFIDAHAVDAVTHVDMQAAFQRHCDSGISKTINLPEDATIEDVKGAYLRAWETGCKGVTVYRDKSREGVLHKVESKDSDIIACCEVPNLVMESGCETCHNCGVSKCLIA